MIKERKEKKMKTNDELWKFNKSTWNTNVFTVNTNNNRKYIDIADNDSNNSLYHKDYKIIYTRKNSDDTIYTPSTAEYNELLNIFDNTSEGFTIPNSTDFANSLSNISTDSATGYSFNIILPIYHRLANKSHSAEYNMFVQYILRDLKYNFACVDEYGPKSWNIWGVNFITRPNNTEYYLDSSDTPTNYTNDYGSGTSGKFILDSRNISSKIRKLSRIIRSLDRIETIRSLCNASIL